MYTWLSRILVIVFFFQTLAPQMLQAQDTYQVVVQGIAAGKDQQYMNKVREIDQEFQNWRTGMLEYAEFNLEDPEDQEVLALVESPWLERSRMLKILWFDRIFLDGRHAKLWENYYYPQLTYNPQRGIPTEKSVCKLYKTLKDLHTESSWMKQVEEEANRKEFQQGFNQAYWAERDGNVGATSRYMTSNIKLPAGLINHAMFTRSVENGTITLDELVERVDPWRPDEVNYQDIITAAEILGNSLDAWTNSPEPIEPEQDEDGQIIWNEEIYNQSVDEFLLKLQLRVIYRLDQLGPLSYKSDSAIIQAAGTLHILLLKIRNFYNAQHRPNPLASKSYSCGSDYFNYSVTGPYSAETFSNNFYKQIQRFSNSSYDANSKEYQQFLMLLDYAIAHEVTRDFMGNIELYVKILDTPLKRNKYDQRLSPALEHLFLVWYENVRYNNNNHEQHVSDMLRMFSQFTDKEKYALPTRVFALEVLSNITYNQKREPVRQFIPQAQDLLGFRQQFYNYTVSDQWRAFWAQQVADIYCPLVSEGRYSMEDYGLNSSQMKKLADKLGSIYANFVRTAPEDPNSHQLWSGDYTTNHCTVRVSGNPINMLKQKEEMDLFILRFAGEVIFWVYGGEIFAFVGVAFRVTRGAMVALPKAIKAANMANRGRKGMAFAIEIQKGTRMANLSSNLAKNGISVSGTRAVVSDTRAVAVAEEGAAAMGANTATKTVNLSSNHALRNQYSRWNPRYWLGQKPGPVLEYQVVQQTPGFGMKVGTVSGAKLPNGIRSYQDWRIFRSNLLDATGQRMTLNSYSFAEQQLLRSEAYVLRSVDKMVEDGAFDLWLPNGVGYSRLRGFSDKGLVPSSGAPQVGLMDDVFITPFAENAPATASSVNIPGLRVPLVDLLSGTWKQKLTQELYVGLDWGDPVSNLLFPRYIPKHVQMLDTPGRMLLGSFQSSSLAHGMLNTTKFFVGMDMTDRFIYPYFKRWISSTAAKEQDKQMRPYATVFDPKLLEEDAKYEQEVMDALQEQGFNTAPVTSNYEDIAATVDPLTEHEGASLSFPLVAAIHYSSKLHSVFWNSPFESDVQAMLLQTQAHRLEINRLVRKYNKAKDRQQVNEFYQQLVAWSRQNRSDFEKGFASFKQTVPDGWAQDEADVSHMLDLFETEIRAALSIENAGKSSKQLDRIYKRYQKQVEKKIELLNNKFDNTVLSREINPVIAHWQMLRDSYEEDLQVSLEESKCAFLIPKIGPWVKRYHQLINKFIGALENIKRSSASMEEKIKKIDESVLAFFEEKEQFMKEIDVWVTTEVSHREQQADESPNVSTAPN